MRNNEERLGAQLQDSELPPQFAIPNEVSQKLDLNFVQPTDHVIIPSGGKYYPEGHPLHNVDTVELRQMTAREEDILTSRSLLKKGTAIDKMLESLIIDKRIKVQDLYLGDKNALLIAARIGGYGPEYETQVICPTCETKGKKTFDLQEHLDRKVEMEEELPENCSRLDNGNVLISLPKTKWLVECRLLNGADEARMIKTAESRKKFSDVDESKLSDQLESMIVSIQGVTDKFLLQKAIFAMPASDSKTLRRLYAKCVPNVDLSTYFVCENCGHEQEMEVPFTTDFFWPKQ